MCSLAVGMTISSSYSLLLWPTATSSCPKISRQLRCGMQCTGTQLACPHVALGSQLRQALFRLWLIEISTTECLEGLHQTHVGNWSMLACSVRCMLI
jgi:hypothetical protein